MTARLVIVQPRAFVYRRTFYRGLRRSLADNDIDLQVVVGSRDGSRLDSFEDEYVHVIEDRLSANTGDRLRWRSPRRVTADFGTPDLVIIEQAVKNLDGYAWMMRQRHPQRSVAMWGQGRTFSTHQGPVLSAWKQFCTRRCAWFFAYTDEGADHVVAHGFPRSRVTVVGNTLDTETLTDQLHQITGAQLAEFRRRHHLTKGRTALFLGGVDACKDIDFLLEAAFAASRELPGFTLLVGGAGDELHRVMALESRGAPVRALGRVDDMDKALLLASSDLLMIPTWIGLVAVDSLAAGIPIVTRQDRNHSPEASYLRPGADSVWLARDVSPQAYGAAVADVLTDTDWLAGLQRACAARAGDFSMEGMVGRFQDGVLAWDEIRRFRL